MERLLYAFGAFLVYVGGIAVYQLTIALVASSLGIRVREVAIGVGPTVFKRVGKNWTFRIGAILTGGSTRFHGWDDADDTAPDPKESALLVGGAHRDAAPPAQVLTVLSGPLAMAIVGLVCTAIPVWAGARQLEACAADESTVRPCGVPGLRLRDQPASWQAQWGLFRDTALRFSIPLVTFQSMEGWGGLLAFFVTCGELGALSFAAWLSAVGILLLWLSALNLLPVPTLNGFHFLQALGRWITGHELPENVRFALMLMGVTVMLIFMGRAVWVDLCWFSHTWFG